MFPITTLLSLLLVRGLEIFLATLVVIGLVGTMRRRVCEAMTSIRKPRTSAPRQSQNGSPTPSALVSATRVADIVSVPKRRCLAIDGAGPPKDAAFAEAIGALYGTSYALKFARKKVGKSDFKVAPLEGRWTAEVPPGTRGRPSPETWRWRLRIGVPSDATKADLERTKRDVVSKKGGKLEGSALVPRVFLEAVPAQRLGRILHVGPYDQEAASFELVSSALERVGLTAAPSHLEVYLSNPARTRPAALKTVLLRELR